MFHAKNLYPASTWTAWGRSIRTRAASCRLPLLTDSFKSNRSRKREKQQSVLDSESNSVTLRRLFNRNSSCFHHKILTQIQRRPRQENVSGKRFPKTLIVVWTTPFFLLLRMASLGVQFGGNNNAVLNHRRQNSLCICSPSKQSVSMIRGSGGKRGSEVLAMAGAGLEEVGWERRRGGGNGSGNEAAAAAYEKLDEWMRESVVEIVKNLREAPLLVNVYGRSTDGRPRLETEKRVKEENWDGLRRKWEAGVASFPDGVIFVEELDDDNGDGEGSGNDEGGDAITRAWGLVVQGRGEESGPACYLLKTSKVDSGPGFGLGMGLGCTHFCLIRVNSFREKAQSQLQNCWLLQAQAQAQAQ